MLLCQSNERDYFLIFSTWFSRVCYRAVFYIQYPKNRPNKDIIQRQDKILTARWCVLRSATYDNHWTPRAAGRRRRSRARTFCGVARGASACRSERRLRWITYLCAARTSGSGCAAPKSRCAPLYRYRVPRYPTNIDDFGYMPEALMRLSAIVCI